MRTPSSTAPDFVSGLGSLCAGPNAGHPFSSDSPHSLARPFLRVACLGALLVAGLFGAAPAHALTQGHAYAFSFGSQGTGNGQLGGGIPLGISVGIDQSNGDVYVTDSEQARIVKFDASGDPLEVWGYGVADGANELEVCKPPQVCQAGQPGSGPGQLIHPDQIVVDNSGGPNDGDVYVVDGINYGGGGGNGVILKFSSSGEYLGEIDGSDSPSGRFSRLAYSGILSIDANGFLWVSGNGAVMKFGNDEENEYIGGSEWMPMYPLVHLAVNAAGTKMMAGGYPGTGGEGSWGVSTNGSAPGPTIPCGGSQFSGTIAADFATDVYFIGNGGEICEATLAGKLLWRFGAGHIAGAQGVAVNYGTGYVYVADPFNGPRVDVFRPRVVPDVTTGDVTSLGHTSATLTGQVAPDPEAGGDVTECHFEIGTDTTYGMSVPCGPATPISAPTAVAADVSGLSMDTTYHYRLVASNAIDANAGEDRTVTPRAVLGLSTDPATEITQTSVTLNGSLDPNGDDTHYYFEWGHDSSYGNTTADPPGEDAGSTGGPTTASATIGGLTSYTDYHYRLVASNSLGTSYGPDEVVRTAAPLLPTVSETAASMVTTHSATIGAVIKPGWGDTTYRVDYGPERSYGRKTAVSPSVGSDNSDHQVTASLTGLLPGTTYHYRVIATNFSGATQGPDSTFTTQDLPRVVSSVVSSVTTVSALVITKIDPSQSATSYSIEYGSTAGAYGSAIPPAPLAAPEGQQEAISTLHGLNPGSTYHFRVVATNAIGTTLGPDGIFTTALPTPSPPRAGCGRGFVKRSGKCVKRHRHHRRKKRAHKHG